MGNSESSQRRRLRTPKSIWNNTPDRTGSEEIGLKKNEINKLYIKNSMIGILWFAYQVAIISGLVTETGPVVLCLGPLDLPITIGSLAYIQENKQKIDDIKGNYL